MAPRESLKEMLVVHPAPKSGHFRIELESFWGQPIVGDLLARLVLAARAAGESASLRSLQATVAPTIPAAQGLDLRVERIDGVCRFEVVRGAGYVCTATARFGPDAGGPSYQHTRAPATPNPDSLPSTRETARTEGWPEDYARGPFEFRRVGPRVGTTGFNEPHITWIRPRAPLPDAAAWHAAALVFVSEFYSHWAFEWQLGTTFDYAAYTPLDHSVWLHGPPRFDDWVLIVAHSDWASNGHAVARRTIYSRDGQQLASAVHCGRVSLAGTPR